MVTECDREHQSAHHRAVCHLAHVDECVYTRTYISQEESTPNDSTYVDMVG